MKITLSSKEICKILKRTQLFEHDFAVTGWALSILPEIRDDIKLNLDGYKRMVIERVIAKRHVAPNPNSKVANDDLLIYSGKNWTFSE